MSFVDYLSRHPNSQPTDENIDENHVLNTLNTTHRKLTNQIAPKLNTYSDVNLQSKRNEPKPNRFSPFKHC